MIPNIPFGHSAMTLDLYLPPGSTPAPATVYFHGGAWRAGARRDHAETRCVGLASRGIAVASADYRLAPEHRYPAQHDDAADAAEWLREHGDEHGLSTMAIGAWGASAGGHLAALLGTGGPRRAGAVDAVAALFAPLLIEERLQLDPSGPEGQLLAGADAEQRRDADPWSRAADGVVPFLLLHGDADRIIDPSTSARFQQRLTACGAASSMLVVGGAGHEDDRFGSPLVLDAIARFFREVLA